MRRMRGWTSTVLSRDFGPPCTVAEFAAPAALLGPDLPCGSGTLSALPHQQTPKFGVTPSTGAHRTPTLGGREAGE